MRNIPVLIIGAGPVGLSLSLALARQKVGSIVIEKHSGTTNHPRARGVNVRTMELFRQWGVADELLKYEQPKEARRFIWAESLQGDEITRITLDDADTRHVSPMQSSLVSQDHVEEALLKKLVNDHNSDVQFSKEFISYTEDDDGITVKIYNKTTQQDEYFRCQFLIAADGAHSTIRKQLDINMEGQENLGQLCSVYCEFDISQFTKQRPCIGYFFTDLKIAGRFLASVDGKNKWIVGLRFTPDQSRETFSDDYCLASIRSLVNIPDLPIHIINKSFWTMAAQIATQFQKGRVFLVGDAAHRLPPTGGFGMNTGIQDAHNLAWKLAFVINSQASPVLLNSYFQERFPVAKKNIDWSTDNAKRYVEIYEALFSGNTELLKMKLHEQQNHLNNLGLDLGFIYHSDIISSENNLTISVSPSHYVPTTLPGSRAPHIPLIKDGITISTLDLFEKNYVLLIGSDGEARRNAINEISKTISIPVKTYRIAPDGDLTDPTNTWNAVYEISTSGAVLVRPDGHVAWRSHDMLENPLFNDIFKFAINRPPTKVELSKPNPAWCDLYNKAASEIKEILKDNLIEIHHIGSTAIPNIYAKPIIDILPVVKDINKIDLLNSQFEALGYTSMGEYGMPNRRFFWRSKSQRTHNVHIYQENSPEILRHLAFKNYLIAHPEEANAYSILKRCLAEVFSNDIQHYVEGKDSFIQMIDYKAGHVRPAQFAAKDDIVIVPYQDAWPKLAEAEMNAIKQIPNGVELTSIEHIGSTAVPELASKPIIDILITVPSIAKAQQWIRLLETLGYVYWDENPDKTHMRFFKGMPPYGVKRTHHIHIVETTNDIAQQRILFRDILRKDKKIRDEYELLKMRLAELYLNDREKYTDMKGEFIASVLQKTAR